MIGYLTQLHNPDNKTLPDACPWMSWHYQEGVSLPNDAIIVTDEEYSELVAYYAPMITSQKRREMYEKRAAIKDSLIGIMNDNNVARIEAGIWTVDLLKGILSDPHMEAASSYVDKLSFELAIQEISLATNPLLTNEIKSEYISLLMSNLFKD